MAERLLANSVISQRFFFEGTACWEWTGRVHINRTGMLYGKMNVYINGKHKTMKAHRVAITAFDGRVLKRGAVGMHKCDISWCINPAHLAGGSQSSNVRDCVKKGRHRNQHS